MLCWALDYGRSIADTVKKEESAHEVREKQLEDHETDESLFYTHKWNNIWCHMILSMVQFYNKGGDLALLFLSFRDDKVKNDVSSFFC